MTTFDATIERAVAIELREKLTTLYLNTLTIYQIVKLWTLNGLDPSLPDPFDVGAALHGYDAIKKEALQLTAWGTQLKAAQPGDTLNYPPPGALSGQIEFDKLSFETIIF